MDSRSAVLISTLIKWLSLLTGLGDAATPSFSPVVPIRVCPGETAIFTCTVVDPSGPPPIGSLVWTGSAFHSFQCANGDEIRLFTDNFERGTNDSCSNGAVIAQATGIDGDGYTSRLYFTLSPEVNGKTIECRLSTTTVGRPYNLSVAGPPSAPDMKGVGFSVPRQQLAIQWDGTLVISEADITGFVLRSQGPSELTCEDTSSDPNAMETRCSWPPSAVGQTFNLTVSALSCGDQEGPPSESISVTLRVPEAPTLSVCPVYDQSTGELLRIESTSSTVPAVTIADGVDVSPDAYIFSYNGGSQPPVPSGECTGGMCTDMFTPTDLTVSQYTDAYIFSYNGGSQSVVPSGQCTGGTCTDVFTPSDPTVSQYTVSVIARNVVGEGPADTARPIDTNNNLLEVVVDVDTSTVQCGFLGGFTGTAECQIEYSPQEDLSGGVVDTGSSTSGDTITVTLTTTLEGRTTYYYLVTATAEGVSVRVQGSFQINCSALNTRCEEDRFKIGLGTAGAVLYSVMTIIIILVVVIVALRSAACTLKSIALVVLVTLFLPPVGLVWLLRKQDNLFSRKRWKIFIILGISLWFVNFIVWIMAVIFGLGDAATLETVLGVFIAGLLMTSINVIYWIVIGLLLIKNTKLILTLGPVEEKRILERRLK